MTTDMLTITDCRRAGFCVKGIKRRCAELGLDFTSLVKYGLPLEIMEPIKDANVQRCIEFAKRRIHDGR